MRHNILIAQVDGKWKTIGPVDITDGVRQLARRITADNGHHEKQCISELFVINERGTQYHRKYQHPACAPLKPANQVPQVATAPVVVAAEPKPAKRRRGRQAPDPFAAQ